MPPVTRYDERLSRIFLSKRSIEATRIVRRERDDLSRAHAAKRSLEVKVRDGYIIQNKRNERTKRSSVNCNPWVGNKRMQNVGK